MSKTMREDDGVDIKLSNNEPVWNESLAVDERQKNVTEWGQTQRGTSFSVFPTTTKIPQMQSTSTTDHWN